MRFPLRLKLWIFAAALLIAHVVGVGWGALALTRSSVERSQRELQIAIIETISTEIRRHVVAAQDGLDLLGRTLTDETLSDAAKLSLASSLVSSNEALDNAIVFAADGSLITPIVEDSVDVPDLPALSLDVRQRAIAAGSVSVDAVATADGPRFLLVVPMQVLEETTGFAASYVATTVVQDAIATQAVGHFEDPQSALFVVDAKRRYLAHPSQERADALASAANEPAVESIDTDALGAHFSVAAEFSLVDETPMVATIVGLPRMRWAVVAQVPERVAYAPVIALKRVVAIALAVAVLIALVSSSLLANSLTSPLQKLSVFAQAIAKRDFTTKVTVTTSDELGLLSSVMARAAEDLQTSEEMLVQEEAIRADLRRYLPGELVDKVVRREQDMALGGEQRDISVLFADVVAFTPLTVERRPVEVVEILNELFSLITEIVFRHGGTVDKFIGDCVMAMWGAPNDMPGHAAAAVDAADELISWLEAGNARWKEKYGVTIEVAVGINSGPAVVGNIGSKSRMEYTAIGETVNVAARLEAIARPMQILVTEATKAQVGSEYTFARVGERVLAGRTEPIQLWEVIS